MSYHRNHCNEDWPFPRQPSAVETARDRLATEALESRIKSNAAVTREEVLYMFDTMPIVGCFGGPVPEYPADVKAAVETMASGAVVPAVLVRRVYKRWRPW